MSFRFTLAPLLRLRKSIERQRTLQLQDASFKAARVQETLEQLDRCLSEAAELNGAGLEAGCTGAELRFAAELRENLFHFRAELQLEMQELERVRQQAVRDYHQAYREREILDTLRVRQLRAHQQKQACRQQQELDEAYLLQRWHHRK